MDFIGLMAGMVLGAAAVWFWAKARVASWKTLWEARGEELDKLAAKTDTLDCENRELISGKQKAETELLTLRERMLRDGEERERHFQEQLRLVEEELVHGYFFRYHTIGIAIEPPVFVQGTQAGLFYLRLQYGLIAHYPRHFVYHIVLCMERGQCAQHERGKKPLSNFPIHRCSVLPI